MDDINSPERRDARRFFLAEANAVKCLLETEEASPAALRNHDLIQALRAQRRDLMDRYYDLMGLSLEGGEDAE